ncbi:MAG: MATE family efflux transporter [Methylocystaceae bacterium]
MLEMIMYMIIGIVDIAVVGHLGAIPLAAVSLGAEIFFGIALALSALGVGAGIIIAQAWGANNLEEVSQVVGFTYLGGMLLGLVCGGLGFVFTPQIVGLFPLEAAVYHETVTYLRILFIAAPLALTMHTVNPLFRGLGRTDIPMKIAFITNSFNIIACVLLVYGLWGLPRLEVAGSALATALAYGLGFIIITIVMLKGKTGIKLSWPRLRSGAQKQLSDLFSLGVPSLTEETLRFASSIISSFLITSLGTVAFAAHNVAINVESLSFMPGTGIAMAATTLVGQAVGAANYERARAAARGCFELTGIIMCGFGLVFALFPETIAHVFTSDAAIIGLAGLCIRISSLEQITMALDMVLGGTLRGIGDTRTPMYISLFFTWVFRLPLMYLLSQVWMASIAYIWILFVIDWFLRGVTYLVIFRKKSWFTPIKE